jgi:hypothetical protein
MRTAMLMVSLLGVRGRRDHRGVHAAGSAGAPARVEVFGGDGSTNAPLATSTCEATSGAMVAARGEDD